MEPGGYVAAAAAGAAAGQVHPDATGYQRETGLPRRDATGYQRETGLPRRDATGYQRETGLPRRDATGYQRETGLPRREPAGYQRQADPGWQETTDYRREIGPFGPGPGPAGERYQNGRSQGADSLSRTGQLRALSNGTGVRVAQEAHDDAAAIREAAQLEAAAIREAAERQAAELRARLDSMLGELDRIAPPMTGGVAAPPRPATTPALPGAEPGVPGRTRVLPRTAPALPGAEPAPPRRTSARPAIQPTRPDTRPSARPAGPKTTSARQPQTQGRQGKAMRVFVWSTAAMLAFATISATVEIAEHGFSFFTFREGGVGETPGNQTDQDFEQGNINTRGGPVNKAPAPKTAAHQTAAPIGRHHKPSTSTAGASD